MGNSIIVKRIKGITQYYASDHIFDYKEGDFLRLVSEFDNPYDHNALAIYDDNHHKLGFIDKRSNVEVYQTIKNVDYFCIITHVYADYSTPSIEFEIIYRTDGTREEISGKLFNEYLAKYNPKEISRNAGSMAEKESPGEKEKKYKNVESYTSFQNSGKSKIAQAVDLFLANDYDSVIDVLSGFEDGNNADALYWLGASYTMRNCDKNDLKKAMKCFKRSFDKGKVDALLGIATAHYQLEEYEEAFSYYKQAAAHKLVESYKQLADCYADGLGTSKNLRLAFLYYKLAAVNNNIEGQYSLGTAYEFGEGTPVNRKKAFEWYTKAADQGHADAVLNLGIFYYEGWYVNRNLSKAKELFERTIKLQPDDAVAYGYIGQIEYQNLQYKEAVASFKMAFKLGDENASYNIGVTLKKLGQYEQANKWFMKAKELGVKQAEQVLEE